MKKPDKAIDDAARPPSEPINEGEGSRTAARAYNVEAERFAKSGQVEKKAREAQRAVDGKKGKELVRAEAEGKSHSAGEDRPARQSGPEEKQR